MNVPKLRFKEFNDEYKSIKLKAVSEIYDGTHETPNYVEKGVKFVSVENISNLLDTTKFIPESDYNKYKIKPKYNDVFMTRIGDIGTSSIYKSDDKLAYYVSLALLRTKDNHILIPDYLNQYIKNNSFQKELYNRTIHVAFPKKINTGEIGECSINLCSDKEQLKVSNFLSLLDKKIELQFKKIEDLKLFKKGHINHIIENNEIEKISLKNILVEQNNKTSKNNEYEILSSTSKGIYLQKDYFNKQAASDNNVGYKILKKNQLVLSPQNLWMGNINVNTEYNIGIVSPSYKIFNISNNINIDFFNYWIKSPKALFEYKISSEQGASIVRRNLNMDLFYEIIVDVPRGKLQNKVGKIIKLLNLNIQYNEFLLQKLSELKKGLMQNMFV